MAACPRRSGQGVKTGGRLESSLARCPQRLRGKKPCGQLVNHTAWGVASQEKAGEYA